MNLAVEKEENNFKGGQTDYNEDQKKWMEKTKASIKKSEASTKRWAQLNQEIFDYMFYKLNDNDKEVVVKMVEEQKNVFKN